MPQISSFQVEMIHLRHLSSYNKIFVAVVPYSEICLSRYFKFQKIIKIMNKLYY